MHLNCPHCHNRVQVVSLAGEPNLSCPSCGSQLPEVGPETVTEGAAELGVADGVLLNGSSDAETRTWNTAPAVQTIGRFRVVDYLGSGHFGDVWLAVDPTLDRRVAIKLARKRQLTGEQTRQFLREARTVARLKHPHIVAVHEAGQEGDQAYIVVDYISGVTLAEWLTVNTPTPRQAAALCVKIAQALHFAHENGVVHRDVKPGNVMIDGQGEPHLVDFGLAKRDTGEITITVEGRVLGTPAYMSPEQAKGEGHHADRRSDVYSLGVVLYELLTRHRPFKGESRILLHQVLHDEPKRPRNVSRGVPRDLETICLKAIAKSPKQRYANAAEMADDLQRWLEGRPIQARPVSPPERAWRWCRRKPLAATGVAVIALLLGSLAALLIGQLGEPPRRVVLSSNPPGAKFIIVPLDSHTRAPLSEKKTVLPAGEVETRLHHGNYLVVAILEGHGFHEVYRHVPHWDERISGALRHQRWVQTPSGAIELERIDIPAAAIPPGMKRIDGGYYPSPLLPGRDLHLEDFYIQTNEMSLGASIAVMPFSFSLAAGNSRDDPATHVDFDTAVAAAEKLGLRLPTEAEWHYVATNAGTTKYPWGDDDSVVTSWPAGRIGADTYDRTPGPQPVLGLWSGVAEWTDATPVSGRIALGISPENAMADLGHVLGPQIPVMRVVRGGGYSVARGQPDPAEFHLGAGHSHFMSTETREPGLGFRCVRSARPRFTD